MTTPDPAARTLLDRVSPPAVAAPPPDRPGLVWRPLQREDVPALGALVAACESVDDPPYRTTPAELDEALFDGEDRDPGSNTLAAVADDGSLVAYGRVRVLPGDERVVRAFLGGGVHPEHRRDHLGTQILQWQTDRARQMLAETGKEVPVRIATYVDDGMTDHAHLLSRAGFSPLRYYTDMRRDLAEPVPAPTSLDGSLVVEPWTSELDEQIRLAHNEAFADHWGSEPQTTETWREGDAHFAPEWSFIVMDRSTDRVRIAGYLISGRYEQDWDALGYTVGYTDLLGVRRDWRGRRVATALLGAAMRAYAASGMQYAGLGVDTDNPTAAFGLYERLGYRATRGSALYTIEL